MKLNEAQKADLQRQIAEYEGRRDQLLAEANMAQGAVMALRGLLAAHEKANDEPDRS